MVKVQHVVGGQDMPADAVEEKTETLDAPETEELELVDLDAEEAEAEEDQEDEEEQSDDEADGAGSEAGEEGEGGEHSVSITIEGEEDDEEEELEKAPKWVKDLRKSHRDLKAENRRLKKEAESREQAKQDETLGERPTLEAFDYDDEKYSDALLAWHDKKARIEKQQAQAEEQAREAEKLQQRAVQGYHDKKAELALSDFDEVEKDVASVFNPTQLGIMATGTEMGAQMIYAVGKSKAALERLSKITDPVKFAIEVGRLEGKLKVIPKTRKAPPAEKRVQGGGAPLSKGSTKLDREMEKAMKSGDVTALRRIRKQQAEAAKK